MSVRRLLHVGVCALGLIASPVSAQTPPASRTQPGSEQPPPSESDPTQMVFLSTRSEFTRIADSVWTQAFLLRADRVVLRERPFRAGKIGVLTRFDLPIVVADRGAGSRAGLGDLYIQGLFAPFLNRRFAFALGTGLVLPTATDRTLGAGKWRLAPLALPIWFFPRAKGFFFVKVQQHWSFAGDDERPDVSYLLTTPTVLYRPARRWWVLLDTEGKKNWEPGDHTAFSSGLEVGYVVNRRMALAVKPEVGWGANRERDWTLKVIATWYRP